MQHTSTSSFACTKVSKQHLQNVHIPILKSKLNSSNFQLETHLFLAPLQCCFLTTIVTLLLKLFFAKIFLYFSAFSKTFSTQLWLVDSSQIRRPCVQRVFRFQSRPNLCGNSPEDFLYGPFLPFFLEDSHKQNGTREVFTE